jgi:RNA polymerase sigma-70 factor (ECF subfamily)
MATLNAKTDYELISLFREGEQGAFTAIYERYHDKIYSFIRKYLRSSELSEDICQNVFTKFWEQREQPMIIHELAAWLFTVAKRQSLDFLRRAAVEQAAMGMILSSYPVADNAENEHIGRDYLAFIEKVLDTLPEQTKQIFKLCRQQHKSYDEAAEILGISRNTVKKHMVRSMRVLKDAAENELGISLMVLLAVLVAKP